ncbi:MAG: hypothetical protein GWO84_01785, partial [Euryarchaeota archaeon]|nr:hypothetical protein [Euryarchaeota archaeon]
MAEEGIDAVLVGTLNPETESSSNELNIALGSTVAISFIFLLLAAILGPALTTGDKATGVDDSEFQGEQVYFTWDEPEYMPRHEECIDLENGQDPGYEGYGIGYEPSLSIDSQGNLFVTAHKDLRWGGEGTPLGPILEGPLDFWYACEDGEMTSWDYWASWFWISNDNGETWGHGSEFVPTPGNHLQSCPTLATACAQGASQCLGDEGDIAVDANDMVYYLDTTLEDNWWHIFSDGGNTY